MTSTTKSDPTIKLGLRWLVAGALVLFAISMAGGIVGQQLFRQPLPPLEPGSDRLVTTVQQVTISPNERIADIVDQTERSIMLLKTTATAETVLGTAAVVTNDGLLVTTVPVSEQIVAIDDEGRVQAVDIIGRDTVYGITFLRLKNAVVAPLDIRQGDAGTGTLLWSVSQTPTTYSPLVEPTRIRSYDLPTGDQPEGWQRVMRGSSLVSGILAGSPLLDEEGKVAGLTWETNSGTFVPVSQLQASMNRLASNAREINPFEAHGFTVTYQFYHAEPDQPATFRALVTQVTPESPAAAAGLKRGDAITALRGEQLQWDGSLVSALAAREEILLTVHDTVGERNVTLAPLPSS